MRAARIIPMAALLALAVGCAPRDPLEQVVTAPTLSRFASWRARLQTDGNAELRRRVGDAIQEIRTNIAGNRELTRAMETTPSDPEQIDETVRKRVDGRSLRQVLQHGYELRVRRLNEELAGLEDAMKKNAQLVTRPGDVESRQHLEGLSERQRLRVEKYRADIAVAERELASVSTRSRS